MRRYLLAALFFSANVMSSSIDSTVITRILVGPAFLGKAFLTISPAPTPKAICNTDNGFTYAFDTSTDTGKATLSVALSAFAAGKQVKLTGTNICDIYGGTENLAHIVVQ